MSEAESELITGFANEYGGMRFGFLFLAEFSNMFIVSALGVTLFFGGWYLPVPRREPRGALARPLVFMVKAYIGIFVMMWARGSLPRIRVDQLLAFAWKALIPISLSWVVIWAVHPEAGDRPMKIWGTGILNGFRITMRNWMRGPITVQYPEQRLELPERARWTVTHKYNEDGTPKCTGVPDLREGVPGPHPPHRDVDEAEDGTKHIDTYVYEVGACMMCGLCVEACPFDAIYMSHEYELATTRRRGPLARPARTTWTPYVRSPSAEEGGAGCLSTMPAIPFLVLAVATVVGALDGRARRATSCTPRSGCSRS